MPEKTNKLEEVKKHVAELHETAKKSVTKEDIKNLISENSRKFQTRKSAFAIDDEVVPSRAIISKRSSDPQTIELQKRNDDIYIMSKILRTDPRELNIYQDFRRSELAKALDTAETGGGAEWLPTGFSAVLLDAIRLELKVANAVRQIPMPTNPYKLPVVASDITAYKVAESTGDAASNITASDPGTRSVTLSAVKVGAANWFSAELDEDSIIPILPFVKDNFRIAIATGVEDAIINGDTTATHQDSDVTAATDVRKAWKGFRKHCLTACKVDASNAYPTVTLLNSVRKLLAQYSVNPNRLFWVMGIKTYIKMLDDSDLQTVDKYGPKATILTGELAKVDGIPVLVSEKCRENLNASAVYDGTTTDRAVAILCFRDGWALGDRRKVTIKSEENIETDQIKTVGLWRGDFEPIFDPTAEEIVGILYNIKTA